jgi:hypothetical protein
MAKLASHGRVELIGTFNGRKEKSLYRCLLHGESQLAFPNHLESGHGLHCCKKAKAQQCGALLQQRKAAEYTQLAATLNLELLEPYQGAKVSVLHRCTIHDHQQVIDPGRIRSGRRLLCCANAEALAKATAAYDLAIAKHGRVARLGPYIGAHTPTLHRCLLHGEEHMGYPASLRHRASGLHCCGVAARKKHLQRKSADHLQLYLKAIKGRMVMLEPYQGSMTPVLHRCLIHGFESLVYPGNAYKGHGMRCCQKESASRHQKCTPSGVHDSLGRYLDGTFFSPEGSSELYLYGLRSFPSYIKVGMDSTGTRPDGEYGEQILSIHLPRIEAWLLEQAVLHETRLLASYPPELEGWAGYTELRRIDPDALISIATDLHNQLLDLGRYEFALRFVPMTAEQAQQIKLRLQSAA